MSEVVMVEVVVAWDDVDVISAWLWDNGTDAVVETQDSVLSRSLVALLAGLPAESAEALVDGDHGDPMLRKVISVRVVGGAADDADAARGWRDHMEPVDCGDLIIVPAWVDGGGSHEDLGDSVSESADGEPHTDGRARGRLRLVMEPGNAFGAGTHVTTRLCAEVIGGFIDGGETVLDFGCGTGILGVAAAMFGAASVTAIDIDPEAVRVTSELASLNGVGERVNASERTLGSVLKVDVGVDHGGDLVDAGRRARSGAVPDAAVDVAADAVAFNIVFANVLIGVIEENGALLADAVAPGGHLVMSGIIESQRDRALHALGMHDSVDCDGVDASDGRADADRVFGIRDGADADGVDVSDGCDGVDPSVGSAPSVAADLVLVSETERDGWLRLVIRRRDPNSVGE